MTNAEMTTKAGEPGAEYLAYTRAAARYAKTRSAKNDAACLKAFAAWARVAADEAERDAQLPTCRSARQLMEAAARLRRKAMEADGKASGFA